MKKEGYKIVLTSPHNTEKTIFDDSLIEDKVAILFGSEVNGYSNDAQKLADEFISIPMYGFTESYNISVSAALVLHDVVSRLKKSDVDWTLSDDELLDKKIDWSVKSIRSGPQILKKLTNQM